MIKFSLTNLATQESPMLAYEAEGDFERNVQAIRIVQRKKLWHVLVKCRGEHKFDYFMTVPQTSLQRAKTQANEDYGRC